MSPFSTTWIRGPVVAVVAAAVADLFCPLLAVVLDSLAVPAGFCGIGVCGIAKAVSVFVPGVPEVPDVPNVPVPKRSVVDGFFSTFGGKATVLLPAGLGVVGFSVSVSTEGVGGTTETGAGFKWVESATEPAPTPAPIGPVVVAFVSDGNASGELLKPVRS